MRSSPRILLLTRNCPFGQTFGGQLRTRQVAQLLQNCGEVRLGLILLEEPAAADLARTRAMFGLETVLLMQQRPIRGLRDRLQHELNPWFLNTEGWCLSAKDSRWVRELAAKFDVVWVHNVAVANGAGIRCWPRTVLDIDDIRTHFYRSAAKAAHSWIARLAALRQVWLWKRRESRLSRRFTTLVVCSEADREYLGGSDRIQVVPNGFEPPMNEVRRCPATPPRIGFVGKIGYPPNADGVRWFTGEVWPRIKKVHPAARLRLVGSGAQADLQRLGSDIDVLGWVEDAALEAATWALTIVPIRIGGGTRIKIAEAFARRCPVVSTTLGAFGYDVRSNEELLLADTPDEFAGACCSVLSDPNLGTRLADRAWVKYRQHWTWEAIAPRVAAAVEHCLRRSQTASSDLAPQLTFEGVG